MIEVKIEVALGAVPVLEELLLERGDEHWMVLEDKPSGRAWLAGYFPARAEGEPALRTLLPELDPEWLAADAEWRELGDADWRDSYKAHFHAWSTGRLHWVPEWERASYPLPPGHVALWLDPGLAFGTGNHETTRLCCERLVEFAAARGEAAVEARVIDAGCGSGILALSAARLGFRDVVGFDNDAEAVRVSRENAALNALAGAVEFFEGDLVTGLAGREAELVMANIQADVLMRFAHELVRAVAPGGELVLSGILAPENAQVQAVFAAVAPEWLRESRTMGEWSDVRLVRPRAGEGDAVETTAQAGG